MSAIDDLLRRVQRDGIDSLAQYERDYLAVWELHAEASSGSLDQYFANSSGDHAIEALQALHTIGAARAADVLQRALDLFGPAGYSPDVQIRNSRLNAIPDEERFPTFTRLTDEFFEASEELNHCLKAYVQKHRPPDA